MRQGFTLVELSIVLVIIGLLIGGILVAQSMVNTAKIQGVVRQLQQYDVAIINFQTKYGQLPGDSNLFPLNGGSSNNDGNIDNCCGLNEFHNTWYHLSLGIYLKNKSGADYKTTTGVTEADCPNFLYKIPS